MVVVTALLLYILSLLLLASSSFWLTSCLSTQDRLRPDWIKWGALPENVLILIYLFIILIKDKSLTGAFICLFVALLGLYFGGFKISTKAVLCFL